MSSKGNFVKKQRRLDWVKIRAYDKAVAAQILLYWFKNKSIETKNSQKFYGNLSYVNGSSNFQIKIVNSQ